LQQCLIEEFAMTAFCTICLWHRLPKPSNPGTPLLLCAQNNPDVRQWMKAHNVSDARALEQYYIRRVLGLVGSAGECA
jgi:hypothetical protein